MNVLQFRKFLQCLRQYWATMFAVPLFFLSYSISIVLSSTRPSECLYWSTTVEVGLGLVAPNVCLNYMVGNGEFVSNIAKCVNDNTIDYRYYYTSANCTGKYSSNIYTNDTNNLINCSPDAKDCSSLVL